jgi:hypothetical protein
LDSAVAVVVVILEDRSLVTTNPVPSAVHPGIIHRNRYVTV